MKILITGIAGFVGVHLAEYCATRGVKIYGWTRTGLSVPELGAIGGVEVEACDIRDKMHVRDSLERIRPDWIFHLAAKSHLGWSWKDPLETLQTNIAGQTNLLEAVRELGLKCRIQVAGSSEEYGLIQPGENPVKEETPLRPVSPYAVSKVAQDLMGLQYFKNYGLDLVRTRTFNQTGPRRTEWFVTAAFARQIALAEAGKQAPEVICGNLEAVRDFTDVRDTVRAYWLCLERCDPGEVYNICSGRGYRIGEILGILMGFSKVPVRTLQDPARLRPSDLPIMIGDGSKFRAKTGWHATLSIEESLGELLEEWRSRIA